MTTEKPCFMCLNYHKCGDREWRACRTTTRGDDRADYWNQLIFGDEILEYAGIIVNTKQLRI